MEDEMKVTDWIPAEVRPQIKGVYEVPALGSQRFQHWNGEFWGLYSFSVKFAHMHRKKKSMEQPQKWRGLAEKPE